MSGKFRKFRNHPAEKSLSIFPIIPREKSDLIDSPSSFNVLRKRSKYEGKASGQKVHVRLRNNMSPSLANGSRQRQSLRKTKSKLDKAARYLPDATNLPTQFPPIHRRLRTAPQCVKMPGTRQISHEEHTKGYKAFILPVLINNKPHSVQHSVQHEADDLTSRKLKEISKLLRPEETPPLFSVYVRWKNNRDGTTEYNQNALIEVFETFGQISNIIYKSRNSAIIVYLQIESACNAVAVMQKIGKDMKLYVKSLNDMM